jgi:hypothetical protein
MGLLAGRVSDTLRNQDERYLLACGRHAQGRDGQKQTHPEVICEWEPPNLEPVAG